MKGERKVKQDTLHYNTNHLDIWKEFKEGSESEHFIENV